MHRRESSQQSNCSCRNFGATLFRSNVQSWYKGSINKGSQNGGVDCDRGKKRHERRRTRQQHKVVRTEDQGLEMPTFDTSDREGHGYGLASVARHVNEVSARVRHENLHPWPERDISLSAPLASLASLAVSAGIYGCQGEFVVFSDRLGRAAIPGPRHHSPRG